MEKKRANLNSTIKMETVIRSIALNRSRYWASPGAQHQKQYCDVCDDDKCDKNIKGTADVILVFSDLDDIKDSFPYGLQVSLLHDQFSFHLTLL